MQAKDKWIEIYCKGYLNVKKICDSIYEENINMKNRIGLTKKIISLLLCMVVVVGIIPTTAYAVDLGTNWWQDLSEDLSNLSAQGSYTIKTNAQVTSQDVLVFGTKSGGTVDQTVGGNNWQKYTAYPYTNWEFAYWVTDYDGPIDDGSNFTFDDGTYYFSDPDNVKLNGNGSSNSTIRINKDYNAKGDFYIAAIFRPKVTLQLDVEQNVQIRDDSVGYTSDSDGNVERYVKYKGTTQIVANIPENRILVNVTVNGNNFNDYNIVDNSVQATFTIAEPTNIVVTTRAKIQKVAFNANGGTGTMAEQTFKHSEAQELSANTFTRSKYKFIGWNDKADGSGTDYTDKQSITFNPTNDGDSITLYAQWEKLPQATYTEPTPNILTYSGAEQNLVSAGTSEGGTLMYSLEKDGEYSKTIPTATNADTYTVWYYVKGDDNHNDTEKNSVDVKIEKMDPKIGTVSAKDVNDTTDISAVVLERTDETTEGSLIVKEGQTLNLGDNEIEYTFNPKDSSNYNIIEGKVNVTVKDTIAPVGTVTLTDAETVWDRIPETITFEIYFKDDQKTIVEATDSFSGVDKVEYYEINEVLDLEGIKLLSDDKWKVLDEDVVTIAEDAKQFIYYIRITDKSGNISYLATNGAEFDTTAPVISGVIDGKTYYTSKEVIITDKNLETVTLNGEEVTDTIILEGNKEATYTIIATDKVGNTTKVTVKMAIKEEGKENDEINKEQENTEEKREESVEADREEKLATGDNIVLYVFLLIASILIIIIIGKKALLKKGKYML